MFGTRVQHNKPVKGSLSKLCWWSQIRHPIFHGLFLGGFLEKTKNNRLLYVLGSVKKYRLKRHLIVLDDYKLIVQEAEVANSETEAARQQELLDTEVGCACWVRHKQEYAQLHMHCTGRARTMYIVSLFNSTISAVSTFQLLCYEVKEWWYWWILFE